MGAESGLSRDIEGLQIQVDAGNKLGVNVTDTKSIVDPTDVGTFVGSVTVNNGTFDLTSGGGGNINFGNNAKLNFTKTSTFTINILFRLNDATQDVYLASKSDTTDATTSKDGWSLSYINDAAGANPGQIQMVFGDNTGTEERKIVLTSVVNENQWYNLHFTYDGSNSANGMLFYMDAVSDTTILLDQTFSNDITTTGEAKIGQIGTDTNFFADFEVKKFEVFDEVLSLSRIGKNTEADKHRIEQ